MTFSYLIHMESLCYESTATPYSVVDKMLEMVEIKPGELLLDVGTVDARIPIRVSGRYGIRSVAVEIKEDLVRQSIENVRASGLEHLVKIVCGDVLDYNLSGVDIVTTYLVPRGMRALRGKFADELKDNARIVSFLGTFEGVGPKKNSGSIFVYDAKSLRASKI